MRKKIILLELDIVLNQHGTLILLILFYKLWFQVKRSKNIQYMLYKSYSMVYYSPQTFTTLTSLLHLHFTITIIVRVNQVIVVSECCPLNLLFCSEFIVYVQHLIL